MTTCVYTSFNKKYLPRAMVLAASVARHHPEVTRVAVLVDEPSEEDRALILGHFDELLLARELFELDVFGPWMFGHDVVEACTAVKGHALAALLQRGFDRVLYMDPDTVLLNPLVEVFSALGQGSVVLTPHCLQAERADGPLENERSSLRYGVFNLGFLAVRNDANGRALAGWWSDRLWRFCIDDPANGLFTDQKWFDLVPGLFDGVRVLRDPGYNVASWNLNARELSITDQVWVNGDRPLAFFHFTKVRGVGDLMLQRNAISWGPVKEVYNWYLRELDQKDSLCQHVNVAWAYAGYADGQAVPLAHRRTYRQDPAFKAQFPDPFRVGPGSFRDWLVTRGRG